MCESCGGPWPLFSKPDSACEGFWDEADRAHEQAKEDW